MRRPLRDNEPTSWTAGEIRGLQDEGDELLAALQACWDEYHELMPDALYEQVKKALGIKVFTARVDGADNADG